MKSPTLRTFFLFASLLAAGSVTAEDIDIYAGNSSNARSNLLVVFDNSGSWNGNASTTTCPAGVLDSTLLSSAGGVETCGMWRAVDAIGNTPSLLGKINMGLMLLGQQNVNGGVFKFPATARPSALPNMDAAGIAAMKDVLSGLKSSGGSSDTSSGRDFGGSTWEAWAFYTGKTGASGAPPYPGINVDTCGKNFVIRVGIADNNAQPGDYNAGQVKQALADAPASPEQLEHINWLVDNKFSSPTNFWADEWSRFMKQNNDITTYTITLVDTSATDTQNVSSYKRYMKSVADVGGGKAFVVDINNMDEFVQALLQIFNEIQAVNSVFASASLPISVNAQGTFENQIFMGMFRPEATGAPRWAGNLKQYQFALDTSDPLRRRLFMADAQGNPALNAAGTGFFSPNAVSFWTSKNTATLPDSIDPTGANGVNGGTAGGFFIFNPQGTGEGFDSPDGEVVEKGGVSQRIRLENLTNTYTAAAGSATNPRRLYTCTTGTTSCTSGSPGSSLSDTPFATENDGITTALLGAGIPGTPISTITRDNTTATVTLGSNMNPVLANGGSVTVSGSQFSQFNGVFSAGGPPTATTFTYPVTVVPPVTATGTGYTAVKTAVSLPITSLTRTGATTVTADVPGHGFVVGQVITISGASTGYDGNVTVVSSTPGVSFTYDITPNPITPGSGGLASVPTNRNFNISSITRATPSGTSPFNATVTVITQNNHNYAVGESVTISGATPSDYNGAYTITGIGNSGACPNPGNDKRTFCFTMPTTPASPAATPGTAGTSSGTSDITILTRTANTCVGGPPAISNATVTATTSAAHNFNVGDVVTISGTQGPDEALYTGSHTISTVAADKLSFTYTIATRPACSDSTTGMQANALGVDRDTLIRWVRGQDNLGDEKSPQPGGPINIRPSIHGDVLHSRPAVVGYPTQDNPSSVVVFYGANDGTFRAINGNQTGNIGTVPPGGELWSFIPPEFFGKLRRMYLNSPVVKLSSTSDAILPAPEPKNYFFDGSIGVFQDLDNGTVYLYITARRGGRLIYAVDVTDPQAPKFMWKRTNTDTDTRFAELGQTWSQPKVALVKGYVDGNGDPKPVLIFGAGYDPGDDQEPPAAATMGRGIYILDALTGDIVWHAKGGGGTNECIGNPCQLADMIYPIPSDVTLVDRNIADESGFIDRLYVPDLGGNVWRVDLEPAGGNTPDQWQVTKLAAVGGTGTTKRKIFFPPDVVTTKNFDAIMFSTGDREHPTIDQQSVNIMNRFYMLKDTNVGNSAAGWTPIVDDTAAAVASWTQATDPEPSCLCLFNASPVLPTTASSEPTSPGPTYDQSGNGFYITLKNAVATKASDGTITYGPAIENGEKAVNAPTTVGGFTFFGTNAPIAPDPSVCQPNLGTARGYRIDFLTGESKFVVFDGGGLPPSPVAGVVIVDGQSIPFLIGGGNPDGTSPDDKSAIGGQEPPIPITPVRSRIYWYRDLGNR